MQERTFDQLVQDITERRRVGDAPPVVLLGAGASIEAGIGAMDGIYELAGVTDFEAFTRYIATRTAAERFRLLSAFLQTQRPAEVTPGYRALAALCADSVFDIILTTNLDPLLDDALAAARLWRQDYLVLVNGVVHAERLVLPLRGRQPRVKVIKLHGDLFYRYMAWTPDEMDAFVEEITPVLKPVLYGRDLLVVGHSLRDQRIRDLVLNSPDRTVWYTSPQKAWVPDYLKQYDHVRVVAGPECAFEALFAGLAHHLGVTYTEELMQQTPTGLTRRTAVPEGAQTMDDFMAAIVGIGPRGGAASMTGLLLNHPRLIVTDGWAGNMLSLGNRGITVFAGDRRLDTRIIHHDQTHPFGPLYLEAPEALKVPGLRLSTAPPTAALPVHIGVAAGERVGLSSGTVLSDQEATIDIAPVGPVAHLIPLEAVVAPGSSGAPVIDEAMNVRGFIVAGSTDPGQPLSYLYPASRWHAGMPAVP